MATPRMAATPSPPPNLHSPPTPRLGFGDNWEPFSPRKSSRLSSKSSIARTPSPSANTRRATRLRSPRVTRAQQQQQQTTLAVPESTMSPAPTPTPRKKKAAFTMDHGHLSPGDGKASSSAEGTRAARAAALGHGMLPTPAKTPSKKHHAASKNESNIAAIARNLFHTEVDEVMSSPSNRTKRAQQGKKYTGFTLESFEAVEDDIPIFTDSQDRVPEVDHSANNPFYGNGAASPPQPAAPRRSSRRNQVSIPGEGRVSVEEASRREDGLVYVFRGKKLFRKFEESEAAQEEDILEGVTPGRRQTRSAIKPRLLFPRDELLSQESTSSIQADTTAEDDEEAVTDIEDHVLGADMMDEDEDEEDEAVSTPNGSPSAGKDEKIAEAVTPNTPPNAPSKYTPATPPITGRTTRSGHKAAAEATPSKGAARAKKRSPFDGWRMTKSSAAAASHKRAVEEPAAGGPAVKRARA